MSFFPSAQNLGGARGFNGGPLVVPTGFYSFVKKDIVEKSRSVKVKSIPSRTLS
ncbi:hypothetical protein LEP1GSC060_0507 [Leptospira weilii serovar Ranarum str. ICFT]|uniref:Uncharacterized protein n=1 Tax=Leptospira weilii serovar Ranarum str. ICFT TaxID=1218598 RepID=N1WN96_9LEPT|nr:hypothetical protein LEP1GSC060_0507 [Leptospira weilii serovar Ranarum str. ICFT]